MTSLLRWGGEGGRWWGIKQKWDAAGRRGWMVSECSGRPILIFLFIKENWICTMTRHLAEPDINKLLTRNLLFDSDVRQWNCCILCGLNRTIERVVNLNAKWLRFVLLWIRSFKCTVRLLFKLCKKKNKNRLIAKCVLKMWIIINKRHFVIFLDNWTHKSIKPRKSR